MGKGQGVSDSAEEHLLSQLMRESQQGNAGAYGELLSHLRTLLEKFVVSNFRRCGVGTDGVQDDVVQEVLMAIHKHRSNYDPNQAFLPWMYAIARYKVIDFLRARKIRGEVSRMDTNLDLGLEDKDASIVKDLERLGSQLSPKKWTVVKMMRLDEYTAKEVSEKTGYSVSDVKVTLHRAMEELKEMVRRQ